MRPVTFKENLDLTINYENGKLKRSFPVAIIVVPALILLMVVLTGNMYIILGVLFLIFIYEIVVITNMKRIKKYMNIVDVDMVIFECDKIILQNKENIVTVKLCSSISSAEDKKYSEKSYVPTTGIPLAVYTDVYSIVIDFKDKSKILMNTRNKEMRIRLQELKNEINLTQF